MQTLAHYRGNSLTQPMLINAFLHFWLEGQPEPQSEVESLKPQRAPNKVWTGIQRFNPLGHSPQTFIPWLPNILNYC